MKHILLAATALTLAGCNWSGSNNYAHQYHTQNQYQSGSYYSHNGHRAPVQAHHGNHRFNNKTSLEFGIGAEEFVGGNISPRAVDVGGDGVISKLEYKDAYDTAWRATGGIAHNVAPRTTLLARGFYKEASSNNSPVIILANRNVGSVGGNYSDYKSYGAEIGFREYLNNHNGRAKLRPYLGATAGVAYLDAIDLEGVNGSTGPIDIEIYDSEWVPTASAVLGVELPVSRRFSMGVESGLRYEGKRESDITGLRTSDAYSVPLTLRGRFQF